MNRFELAAVRSRVVGVGGCFGGGREDSGASGPRESSAAGGRCEHEGLWWVLRRVEWRVNAWPDRHALRLGVGLGNCHLNVGFRVVRRFDFVR